MDQDHLHDCPKDHIEEWPDSPDLGKTFGDDERTIHLSFSHCTLTPDTLVIHLALKGTYYESLQKLENDHSSCTEQQCHPSRHTVSYRGANIFGATLTQVIALAVTVAVMVAVVAVILAFASEARVAGKWH